MATLFFGGMLIMPVSLIIMRLGPGPTGLPKNHPMNGLATQMALTVPFGFLIAIALGVMAPQLFFPAGMIVIGAHYLPFVFLYGQKLFAVLGGLLMTGGALLIFTLSTHGAVGGWLTAGVLLLFGFILYQSPGQSSTSLVAGQRS